MSIDYRGSVVDLLNEAKEIEVGQRLFLLEQVREIMINREQSLLREFLADVMDLSVLANTQATPFSDQIWWGRFESRLHFTTCGIGAIQLHDDGSKRERTQGDCFRIDKDLRSSGDGHCEWNCR